MSPSAPLPWSRLWGAIVLFWLAVGGVTALQQAVAGSVFGAQPLPSAGAALRQLLSAAAWIPFTGAVVWLAWRAPVGRETWRWSLPLHAAAALAVAVGVNLTMVLLHRLPGVAAPAAAGTLRTALEGAARWLHILVLLYAVMVAAAQGVLHALRARRRERELAVARTQLAEARLRALRAQLRPHFLFNALHTLGMLWRLDRAEEAQATLERLSQLLRTVLEMERREWASLEEEVELARAYLAVERARFGDRLRVSADVPDALLGRRVPPLVLQPLVENAIRHGVERCARPVGIHIDAGLEGGDLLLRVRDDGPGPSGDARRPGAGVGLSNLRERLQHRYGDRADAQLVAGPGGEGAVATVKVPADDGGLP